MVREMEKYAPPTIVWCPKEDRGWGASPLHLEQSGAGDNYRRALGTGNRNVQTVQAVQEFHAPGASSGVDVAIE